MLSPLVQLLVCLGLLVAASHSEHCEPVEMGRLNPMCTSSVTYKVVPHFDYDRASDRATNLFKDMVTQIRKVIIWKPEHCIEALRSLACYATHPKCVDDLSNDYTVLKVCDDACEASAAYCNVTAEVIECEDYPREECFEAPVIHGLPCAIPPKLPFCSMISYNSSRSYHGDDFLSIDHTAEKSYRIGSEDLPTTRCKAYFKLQLCENYFRRCDERGITILPCPTVCMAYGDEGCDGLVPGDCNGPQYGPPGNCFDLPLPEIVNNCSVLRPDAGLAFCSAVDYPVDGMLRVSKIDEIARKDALSLIAALSKRGPVSDQCKSRIGDLVYAYQLSCYSQISCALRFRSCENGTTAPSLEPCRVFCESVQRACESTTPIVEACQNFPEASCLDISPSSRRDCSSPDACPQGEYCFFYQSSRGVCLVK